MKAVLFIILSTLTLLFTSCISTSKYQVSNLRTMEGKDTLTFENDVLKLELNFWNYGGALDLLITNKTDSLLFIDWTKSNYIINNIAYACYDPDPLLVRNSTRQKNSQFTRIPPNCIISEHFIGLTVPEMEMEKDYNQFIFNAQNTPVSIRLYIAYSSKEDLSHPQYVDQSYYINSITQLKESSLAQFKQNNRFYIEETEVQNEKSIKTILGIFALLLVPFMMVLLFGGG